MATDWDLRAFIFGLDDLDGEEKEQCFSILDGQGFSAPNKRRAFLALDDTDLQTAGISRMSTRKVLRLALQASAAGLGVWSVTGAGAVAGPGSGSTGDEYEQQLAADMIKALRDLPVVPGPGELLCLEGNAVFHLHPSYSALYVRASYPLLFDALARDAKPTRYIVTGTPGIGKTWFFYYLVARLLKSNVAPPFIVWEHFMFPGKAWCYTHETRQVVVGERTSFGRVLNNPATWYIADGLPPLLKILARTVLLTSPKREAFKEALKEGARLLYMPLWELDELQACRRLLYSTVAKSLTAELFQHYGGVARFALGLPETNPGLRLDELLQELRTAVDGCNTAQMRSSIGSISTGPEVSHRLLHIIVDKETFKMQYLVFASKWVADEFTKKAVRTELKELVSLLSSTSGALYGMLYEATMHAVLAMGGRFTAVPVTYDIEKSTFSRGVEEEVQFDPCTTQEFFQVMPSRPTKQIYYRPSSARFPTVDALRRGEGVCDFFQMTVQDSKRLDTDMLADVIDPVQLEAEETPRLHFVVPSERYPDFRLTAGKKWPPPSKSKASHVKLYIMKGVHARLQVCARSGHVASTPGGGRKLWL